ncbi:MAG: selenium metabolism-associated LysR family transcriptional regulator [Desulfobacteraceae bacterium]|jgi:DNA-binding transcriptional LysR family regulator
MDLWQLKIFCQVVELQSFSKAGESVHLSQPTISSHIKDLEEHFGTRLVDRLSRKVTPTKAGELLFDYAQQLIALRDRTEAAMAEFSGKIRGRLVLGGSTIPAGYVLPKIVGLFSRRYPEVQVALKVGDTSEIINNVLAGHIEAGIVGAKYRDKLLAQEPVLADEMCLVVPCDHPWAGLRQIRLQELLGAPFIVREAGSGTLRSIEQQLHKKGFGIADLNIVAEMGSTEAVRQGIKSGVGLSILSVVAVTDDIQSGILKAIHVEGLNLKRNFYLTIHKQRTISPLCGVFIDFMREALQSDP